MAEQIKRWLCDGAVWLDWKEVLDYKHAKHSPWARKWEQITGTDIETLVFVAVVVIVGAALYLWFTRRP